MLLRIKLKCNILGQVDIIEAINVILILLYLMFISINKYNTKVWNTSCMAQASKDRMTRTTWYILTLSNYRRKLIDEPCVTWQNLVDKTPTLKWGIKQHMCLFSIGCGEIKPANIAPPELNACTLQRPGTHLLSGVRTLAPHHIQMRVERCQTGWQRLAITSEFTPVFSIWLFWVRLMRWDGLLC